jgi:DNA-binding CsgD family transcriptional regulator
VTNRVVGRHSELTALEEFLTRVSGGFECVVLEGEAGVGKSTVWQAAVDRARDRGWNVLSCRPSEAETKLAYAALGDLMEGVTDAILDALPAPQRNAIGVALLREETHGPAPDQRAIGVAALGVLRELSARSPVLIAIDDVQWLDPPTSSVLEFVARRLTGEPIGILSAARLLDEPAVTVDKVIAETRRRVMRLGGLSIGALHDLLSDRLEHVFLRPTLVKIAQASGGNAFYALEIARELLRSGEPRAGEPLPVPEDLRELVAARVRRLPDRTREALFAAAAVSHPVIGTNTIIEEAALRPAEEADIVHLSGDGRVRFTHPLYASAVYEMTPVARRRDLHRHLAAQIDDIEEHARHIALATAQPDEDVAQLLEEGATHARTRGAWQSAAELYEQARGLTPPERTDKALRRAIAAAEHLTHAGNRRRASALLEEILEQVRSGPLRADALRLLGEVRYNDESFRESVRLLEEARQHAGDPRLIAEIELDLGYAASSGLPNQASVLHARLALDLTATLGDDGLHAQALAFMAMSDYLCGRGIDWDVVQRSLALEEPERLAPLQRTPTGVAGLLLLYAGRLDDAREKLQAIRQRAIDRGDESDLAFFLCWLAWLETLAGHLDAAQTYADEAALAATLTNSKSMLSFARAFGSIVSAHRGEVDRARRECDEATRLAQQTAYGLTSTWIVAARCLIELSVDNPTGTWRAAEPLARFWETHRISEPVGLWYLPDALEALIALGEVDRASVLLDDFQSCAESLDRVWGMATAERCQGLLQVARGDQPGAVEHLQRALLHHQRIDMPFEQARTLLCLGRVQRRGKQRKEARETLTRALEIFERVGAPRWADKAHAELDRTHLREAPTSLTPSELRVAELAARGLTNKRIAERLFMSPKTVEANLARVYAKLGIASRAELGARMAPASAG